MFDDALELVIVVVVMRELERIDPAAYSFLLGFARDNELTLRPGRKQQRPDELGAAQELVPQARNEG